MKDPGAGNLAQHASGIGGQALSERAASFAIELPIGIQKVCTVKDAPHHVPFGETNRVIPDRVENSAVDFAFGFRVSRAGRSMPE